MNPTSPHIGSDAISRGRIPAGEFVSSSPQETFNYGHQIGARLEGGEILLLSGPLGAGKTLLVKGICALVGEKFIKVNGVRRARAFVETIQIDVVKLKSARVWIHESE